MRHLHFLFHWWRTVRDTGKTVYQECAVCAQPKLPTGYSSTAVQVSDVNEPLPQSA